MKDRYIKRLVAKSKCGVCGAPYRVDNVSVLGHEDEFWFLSVFCDSCQNERLVAALIRSRHDEVTVEDMPAGMARSELIRFAKLPAVGYDDVLSMHSFLEEFDGDFRRLFGGDPRP